MKIFITFCLLFLLTIYAAFGQTSIIKGIVKDENGLVIKNATVSCKDKVIMSDLFGEYSIEIPSEKAIKITFSHPSYQVYSRRIRLRNKKVTIFSPKLTNNLSNLF